MRNIRAIVFDLDGTLVTSNLNFVNIRREIGCPTEVDVLEYVAGLSESDRSRAEEIIHRHEREDAEQSEWIPGAREFVHKLVAREFPLAILTRNSDYSSRLKLSRNAIPISHLVTRENSKPKPEPDALLTIAKAFSLSTREVLMVGDYKYDLQAGRNASMPTCLVNYEGQPDYLHLADYSFPTFLEFQQHFLSQF